MSTRHRCRDFLKDESEDLALREEASSLLPLTIVYGWLSKLCSLFGYPKYEVPYDINRDPKRCHKFDNHPYEL